MACAVTSCDLDTTPTTSLDAGNVYKDTENAERVLRGAWNYIFNSGSTYASIGIGSIQLNDDLPVQMRSEQEAMVSREVII